MDFKTSINGDILKINCLKKSYKTDEVCRLGTILSNGEFLLTEFKLEHLISIYQSKSAENVNTANTGKKVTEIKFKNILSYKKSDEIFSCFEFARYNRLLLGTQKGTILLGKVDSIPDGTGKLSIKIINSYNRFCNFMITNISIMPDHSPFFQADLEDAQNGIIGDFAGFGGSSIEDKNHFLFAYSTADGYIKIQNTKSNFPIYSYQSISVSILSSFHSFLVIFLGFFGKFANFRLENYKSTQVGL